MSSDKSKSSARAQKVAAERAAQARREARRRILTIGGVVLAMVLIVGGAIAISALQHNKDQKKLAEAASARSDFGITVGKSDAPHKVVIYEDFLCPFCRELESQTRDELTRLAADGKVQVEYRPFNLLGGEGRTYPIRAANAFAVVLDKAGADVAKKYHDLLYENQPSEQNADAEGPDDKLVELAVEAGAKESDVRPGIESLSQQDWVTDATKEAHDAGVSGTPTIVLDGSVFDDGRTIDEQAQNLLAAVD